MLLFSHALLNNLLDNLHFSFRWLELLHTHLYPPTALFILTAPSNLSLDLHTSYLRRRNSFMSVYCNHGSGHIPVCVNILSCPGRVWKVTRRHLSPVFHPLNLDQLMPLMNDCGRDLTSILSGHVGPVDISWPVFTVALKSVHSKTFQSIQAPSFQILYSF